MRNPLVVTAESLVSGSCEPCRSYVIFKKMLYNLSTEPQVYNLPLEIALWWRSSRSACTCNGALKKCKLQPVSIAMTVSHVWANTVSFPPTPQNASTMVYLSVTLFAMSSRVMLYHPMRSRRQPRSHPILALILVLVILIVLVSVPPWFRVV